MCSNWKELTSKTFILICPACATNEETGYPIFPDEQVVRPFPFKIAEQSSVVVVFPFVPVMAINGRSLIKLHPNSSSESTSAPQSAAYLPRIPWGKTPGLITTRSALICGAVWHPHSTFAPKSISFCALFRTVSEQLSSKTKTFPPC